jgi:hypothetical protein
MWSAVQWRRWFQFRLRTFLIITTVSGVALGWWFRPFTVETRRDDGSLRTRFSVRRTWQGNLVAHGKLQWICRDGTAMEQTAYGVPMGDDEFASQLAKGGNFDALIWLITETIDPNTWASSSDPGKININQVGR